jgi:hypothetical protein
MSKVKLNTDVSELITSLNHPFEKEISYLRNKIISVNSNLIENVKWNGPNYTFQDIDCITMRIQPPRKQVQLIFHRGAKKQLMPNEKFIRNKSKLLDWKENDRAVIILKSMEDIKKSETELNTIINEWLAVLNN